jgi:hypothetical protein
METPELPSYVPEVIRYLSEEIDRHCGPLDLAALSEVRKK